MLELYFWLLQSNSRLSSMVLQEEFKNVTVVFYVTMQIGNIVMIILMLLITYLNYIYMMQCNHELEII